MARSPARADEVSTALVRLARAPPAAARDQAPGTQAYRSRVSFSALFGIWFGSLTAAERSADEQMAAASQREDRLTAPATAATAAGTANPRLPLRCHPQRHPGTTSATPSAREQAPESHLGCSAAAEREPGPPAAAAAASTGQHIRRYAGSLGLEDMKAAVRNKWFL